MTYRDMNRKIGFATQPSSVIVRTLDRTGELGPPGAILIVHVPPKFFSAAVTRDTCFRGGSLSMMSAGTDDPPAMPITTGQISSGVRRNVSDRLATCVRGSIAPIAAAIMKTPARKTMMMNVHFIASIRSQESRDVAGKKGPRVDARGRYSPERAGGSL